MANRKINVTELDFDNIKANLKTFLKGQEEFQDYDFEGSGLAVLLDVLAYNTHYNALYNNLAINEMFLDSASKRDSVVSIAKMLGYVPRSASCAKAVVNLTLSTIGVGPSSVTLPAYSTFSTNIDGEVYTFQTTESYTISGAGSQYTFSNVNIIEGTPVSFRYVVAPGSRYIINNPNVDLNTLKVKVQESATSSNFTTFVRSTDITTANSTTNVFFIKEVENGYYELTFGDGIIGTALDNGNVINIQYIVSSLAAPNGAKFFNYTGGTIISNSTISVSTVIAATGGGASEDIESVRFNAPRNYTAQNRAVTPDDYKAIIYASLPEAKTVNVWGGEDNVPPVYGKTFICVKPIDATKLTNQQKSNIISTILASKSVVSITPEIVDPEYINIALNVTVYYNERETTRTAPEIATLVRESILDYNDNELQRFDGMFRFSKLSKIVDNSEQGIINNITTVSLRRKLVPRYNVSAQYLLSIINPIFYSDVAGGSVSTTGFYIYGSDELHYLDDYQTTLRLFRYGDNATKIIVNDAIGTIDHANGILDIRNLHITALADVDFEISIKPQSNDVVSALHQIAQIAEDHLTVTAIPDKSANGDLRAGYNYVFTASQS